MSKVKITATDLVVPLMTTKNREAQGTGPDRRGWDRSYASRSRASFALVSEMTSDCRGGAVPQDLGYQSQLQPFASRQALARREGAAPVGAGG